MAKSNLTASRVRELFTYNKSTGILRRRITRNQHSKKGSHSTAVDRDGYLIVGIDYKIYRAHRVIWLYVNGQWPKGDCDHINRIKTDNRIANLRDVTRSQNKQNQLVCKNNKCGIKGVYWSEKYKRWFASIGHLGEQIYIGQFKTIEEASDAYKMFAMFLHDYNPSADTPG
jgi:HNH endonuclease/AP2 domain